MESPAREAKKTERTPISMGILTNMKAAGVKVKTENTNGVADSSSSAIQQNKKKNSFRTLKRGSGNNGCRMVCIFAVILTIGMIIAGAVVGVKYSAFIGWPVFGVGLLIAIVWIVFVIFFKIKEARKAATEEELDTQVPTFYHTDLKDFPADPVLRRGITNLVFHGEKDCRECKILREKEMMTTSSYQNDIYANGKANESELLKSTAVKSYETTRKSSIYENINTGDATSGDKEQDTSPTHNVTVHEQTTRSRAGSTEVICVEEEEEETSFITEPVYGTKTMVTNFNADTAKIEVVLANNNNNNAKRDRSKHVDDKVKKKSKAILSRDSIFTTKKRKATRNKEWSQRRNLNDSGRQLAVREAEDEEFETTKHEINPQVRSSSVSDVTLLPDTGSTKREDNRLTSIDSVTSLPSDGYRVLRHSVSSESRQFSVSSLGNDNRALIRGSSLDDASDNFLTGVNRIFNNVFND